MEIKRKDLLRLHNVIISLEGEKYSVKFSYFLAKNKVIMRDEIEALEEVSKVSEEFQAFESRRIEIAEKHADKNEDGSINLDIITENPHLPEDYKTLLLESLKAEKPHNDPEEVAKKKKR